MLIIEREVYLLYDNTPDNGVQMVFEGTEEEAEAYANANGYHTGLGVPVPLIQRCGPE